MATKSSADLQRRAGSYSMIGRFGGFEAGGSVSESNRSAAFVPLSGFEDHAHHRMKYAPGIQCSKQG
jgi:hypothetical protein